jgi:DNA polymerase-4
VLREPVADPVGRWVLHVDMDCFFAQVEVRDRPELAGRAVLVGGSGQRAVVTSANYEARRYGVRAAMPMAEARRRCPDAVVCSLRPARYRELSLAARAIVESLSPVCETVSLDEAYVELTLPLARQWLAAVAVTDPPRRATDPPTGESRAGDVLTATATALRSRLAEELGLAASVGLGRSKVVAKLASREAKPKARPEGVVPGRGVVLVLPEDEDAFLRDRAISELPGVGPAMAARLAAAGLRTVDQVRAVPAEVLRGAFGTRGAELAELAAGRDPGAGLGRRPQRTIGCERTFDVDCSDPILQERTVVELADEVARRLRTAGRLAARVSLKVRWPDLRTVTRATTLREPTDAGSELSRAAVGLWRRHGPWPSVRLLGVAAGGLVTERQLRLDEVPGESGGLDRAGAILRAAEEVRARFGVGALLPAHLLSRPQGAEGGRRARP